jgi:hypothetical protein
MSGQYTLIDISKLRSHEAINPERVREVHDDIIAKGYLESPILVDQRSKVILNGHHRYHVLKTLGVHKAPVKMVNYYDTDLKVYPRRADVPVDKHDVVAVGSVNVVFPEKTTRHVGPKEDTRRRIKLVDLL